MPERRKDSNVAAGSAVAGAGGLTAAGGLLAGGIPRAKVDSMKLRHLSKNPAVKTGTKRSRAKEFARNVPKARKGMQGGVGGFRESAHYIFESGEGGKAHNLAQKKPLSSMSRGESFEHGLSVGRQAPERVIMRQMKGLRHGGHVALAGGAGLTAAGVALARHKDHEVKKADHREKLEAASGATLGVGATAAGMAHGGSKLFASQEKKWKDRAHTSLTHAGKVAPRTGGAKTTTLRVRGHEAQVPKVKNTKIKNDPSILAGTTREQSHLVGELRGQAAQQSYFGEVHGAHAKLVRRGVKPALAVAGLGAAGLAASQFSRKKVEKAYNPRLSAFGVEH